MPQHVASSAVSEEAQLQGESASPKRKARSANLTDKERIALLTKWAARKRELNLASNRQATDDIWLDILREIQLDRDVKQAKNAIGTLKARYLTLKQATDASSAAGGEAFDSDLGQVKPCAISFVCMMLLRFSHSKHLYTTQALPIPTDSRDHPTRV